MYPKNAWYVACSPAEIDSAASLVTIDPASAPLAFISAITAKRLPSPTWRVLSSSDDGNSLAAPIRRL